MDEQSDGSDGVVWIALVRRCIFGSPSGPAAWHALPSWYAVFADDRAIDPALQRFMAQRAVSTTVQFAAASATWAASPTTGRGS